MLEIVIANRGFVLVGTVEREADEIVIKHASIIRVWGTTAGLGQLGREGPLEGTKLDPVDDWRSHELTLVGRIKCRPEPWQEYLSARIDEDQHA